VVGLRVQFGLLVPIESEIIEFQSFSEGFVGILGFIPVDIFRRIFGVDGVEFEFFEGNSEGESDSGGGYVLERWSWYRMWISRTVICRLSMIFTTNLEKYPSSLSFSFPDFFMKSLRMPSQ
jgi:hypothetical protein